MVKTKRATIFHFAHANQFKLEISNQQFFLRVDQGIEVTSKLQNQQMIDTINSGN